MDVTANNPIGGRGNPAGASGRSTSISGGNTILRADRVSADDLRRGYDVVWYDGVPGNARWRNRCHRASIEACLLSQRHILLATRLKVLLRSVPTSVKAAIAATAINAAINAYSIAVTPDSSLIRFIRSVRNPILLGFKKSNRAQIAMESLTNGKRKKGLSKVGYLRPESANAATRKGMPTMTISAVVFDAYGTLYDVQSVLSKAERLCPGRGEVIAQVWRLKQLEYTWLRSLLQEYEDFWEVTRAALDFALRATGVEPSEAVRGPLMDNYLHLDPYREAREALAALAGRRLAILSNASPRMLDALVRNSGLDKWIESAISVDRVRTYKPHPSCYALVEQALHVPNSDVLFVSSNGFDIAGAKAFGFKVAWIRRSGAEPPLEQPLGAATLYRMLRGRAEELGRAPDHIVSALTDLPKLL